MRKHLTLLAAASLSAGTFAFLGYDSTLLAQGYGGQQGTQQPDARQQGTGTMTEGRTDLPQGITRSDQTDTQGIRNSLSEVTNAAVRNLDQLTNHLTQSDRQRLGNFGQQRHERLTRALGDFRAHWKTKYNQDFDLGGKTQVVYGNQFQNFDVIQGEVTNPALLGNWPVESKEQRGMQHHEDMQHRDMQQHRQQQGTSDQRSSSDNAQQGGSYADAGGPGEPSVNLIPDKQERGDIGETARDIGQRAAQAGGAQGPGGVSTLERGMDVAVATFPAGWGLPETSVSLVRETGMAGRAAQAAGGAQAGTWKIDIPDNVSSQDLATHLANHIEGLNAGRNSWPNDVNEAYRLVSHHVFQAMYETPTGRAGQAGGQQMPGGHQMHGGQMHGGQQNQQNR